MKQEYFMRSGALMGFADLVDELGGDAKLILSKAKLTLSELTDGDHMIPFESFVMVLEHAAHDLNCPSFGLRLSTHQSLQTMGRLGLLIRNCDSARNALMGAQRYMALHSRAAYWSFDEDARFTFINRYQHFHSTSHARQYKELAMGVCFCLIKALVPNFKGYRLEFSHRPISELKFYQHFFTMDVEFNREQDRLVCDSKYLSQPITNFNEQVHQQVEHYLSELLADHGNDIERQVRSLILQTMGMQEHTMDNIAQLLHMHKRTLQRRLKDKDLNFKRILNEVRISTARWHLEASNMDITLLSEILGYSDLSAFSRAFKTHMKCSAIEWRRQKQAEINR